MTKESSLAEKMSRKIGYVAGYFIFTTLLYYIFKLMHKLPINWGYFHILGITLLITLLGLLIKRLLK